MFDANAFSLDAFDDGSWLFLLGVPYFDLSGKQRVYVRSILESVYSSTETDEIISTAARNAISVLDAAIALRVDARPLQIVVTAAKQRMASKPVVERHVRQPKTQERKNKPAYVVAAPQTAYAHGDDNSLFATTETQQLVAMTDSKPIFINSRTKE